MAIFGFGAYYGSTRRMVEDFFTHEVVGTGWLADDDIAGHTLIKSMKAGDIVYLKRCSPGSPITVLGIGIIKDNTFASMKDVIELGRNIKWLMKEAFVIEDFTDKLNVRYNTAYEEFNPDVQAEIINRIPVA